ncbi:hypothetical protein HID58_082857 [Brassica napus]|uniref:Uncharacterized protein n=1 Tax=Brassica napus TaxID=3708 RepID=A0ABQ7YEL7_BRANA|nr:hypothetical protein HID58_082857 [Brassica napus]
MITPLINVFTPNLTPFAYFERNLRTTNDFLSMKKQNQFASVTHSPRQMTTNTSHLSQEIIQTFHHSPTLVLWIIRSQFVVNIIVEVQNIINNTRVLPVLGVQHLVRFPFAFLWVVNKAILKTPRILPPMTSAAVSDMGAGIFGRCCTSMKKALDVIPSNTYNLEPTATKLPSGGISGLPGIRTKRRLLLPFSFRRRSATKRANGSASKRGTLSDSYISAHAPRCQPRRPPEVT